MEIEEIIDKIKLECHVGLDKELPNKHHWNDCVDFVCDKLKRTFLEKKI